MLNAVHDRSFYNAAILAFDRCLRSEVTIFYGSEARNRRIPIDRRRCIADTLARPERILKACFRMIVLVHFEVKKMQKIERNALTQANVAGGCNKRCASSSKATTVVVVKVG
jgi:hypothetical protein